MNPEILQRLAEQLEQFEVRGEQGRPWRSRNCLIGSPQADDIASSLVEEFSESALMETGLLERGADGGLQLIVNLQAEAGPVIFLQEARDGPPFAVVTRDYIGPSGNTALEDMLGDLVTRELLAEREGVFFLTPTTKQAAALRCIGLAAAPLAGTTSLSQRRLLRLAKTLSTIPRPTLQANNQASRRKTPSPAPAVAKVKRRCVEPENVNIKGNAPKSNKPLDVNLVLAGWNPIEWSTGDDTRVREVARFLTDMRRVLGVEFGGMGCWLPSEADKADIMFTIRHGKDHSSLWRVLRRSIESSCYGIEAVSNREFAPHGAPTNVVQASEILHRRIRTCGSNGAESRRFSAAAEQYQAAAERDLVKPLFEKSLKTADPTDRALLAFAADTVRVLNIQAPTLHRRLAAYSEGRLSDEDTNLLLRELKQRTGNISEFIRLVKAMKR